MGRKPIPMLVGQPAAGADWLANLPGEGWTRVLSVTAKLVTGTTITPRAPDLYSKDATGDILALDAATYAQGAQQTMLWSWRPGQVAIGNVSPSIVVGSTCPGFWLPPGATLGTVTQDITATDQWSNIVVTYDATNQWERAEDIASLAALGIQAY